jgi:hypothetical protein
VDLNKLKIYIVRRIKTLTSIGVYSGFVPSGTSFPYLAIKFPSSSIKTSKRIDRILEIDYWDNTSNDTAILAASEAVKKGLDYMWCSEADGFFQCILEFEGEMPPETSSESHINQRYLVKVR